MKWHTIDLPTGREATLPADVHLKFLEGRDLTPQQLCATAYIPWREKYLQVVPKEYQAFFTYVLPYLNNRTTNVHTALSVSQVPFLISHSTEPVDTRIVYLGTILHDAGWSLVSQQGIADSLSYSGLTLSESSRLPKQQHVMIGAALAYDLLDKYDFGDKPVSEAAKRQISQSIRRHDYDAPWDKGKFPQLAVETKLICDADRLWSYTHENFWQDTVRKNVEPENYLLTISGAIEDYFITPQGKVRAHGLVADRRKEVEEFLSYAKSTHLARA